MEQAVASEVDGGLVDRSVLAALLVAGAEAVAADLDPSDADDPLTTLASTRSLRLLVDEAIAFRVADARRTGASWADIGRVLGVSRQAAFQRFGGRDPAPSAAGALGPLARAAGRATELLDHFLAGRNDDLRAAFDDRMTEACPPDLLASLRLDLRRDHGALVSTGPPAVALSGDFTVVDVPLRFRRGRRRGRLSFNGDGTVAGLFLLHPTPRGGTHEPHPRGLPLLR